MKVNRVTHVDTHKQFELQSYKHYSNITQTVILVSTAFLGNESVTYG